MGKENYYHTGIFTNVSKSTLLMSIVDSVLIRRFNVTTLCGPRTSLNTCEIILHSKLHAGIPDFCAAKVKQNYIFHFAVFYVSCIITEHNILYDYKKLSM